MVTTIFLSQYIVALLPVLLDAFNFKFGSVRQRKCVMGSLRVGYTPRRRDENIADYLESF